MIFIYLLTDGYPSDIIVGGTVQVYIESQFDKYNSEIK